MSTFTYSKTVTMETMQCVSCGVLFAMTADYISVRRKDAANFYCQNMHSMSYHESDADRMRRERDAAIASKRSAEQRAARAETEAMNLAKEAKRQRRRANAGACPCCNRSFVALARHMKTKHPEYAASGSCECKSTPYTSAKVSKVAARLALIAKAAP